MEILPHDEQAVLLGLLEQPGDQRLLRALFLLLRAQRLRRIPPLGNRDRQQARDERNRPLVGELVARQPLFQLGEPFLGTVLALQAQRTGEPVDQRMEGAVLVIRRAAERDAGSTVGCRGVFDGGDES